MLLLIPEWTYVMFNEIVCNIDVWTTDEQKYRMITNILKNEPLFWNLQLLTT